MYALFKEGQQISEPFATPTDVMAEAYKRKVTIQLPIYTRHILFEGFSIRESTGQGIKPKETGD